MERTKTVRFLRFASAKTVDMMIHLFDFLGGGVNLSYAFTRALTTRPFYSKLLFDQCYLIGVRSFSIVAITAISIGMVMCLQFGYGLERFGGKLYVPKVVGLSIMRELGPVLTCLMLAGRVGSGIAAEIGSMKVTQQIDAIRALGTDPIKKCVIPRVLAILIMAPLLTTMADLIGIWAGMVLSAHELYIDPDFYFHEAITSLKLNDYLVGVSKTFFFGMWIGITSCYYGLKTSGGTQGVGQSTTNAVVTSSILIMLSDIILTKLFWIFEKG